jgi:hypothetical protein
MEFATKQGNYFVNMKELMTEFLATWLHCTEKRTVNKRWRINLMYEQIEPLLSIVEEEFKLNPGLSGGMAHVGPHRFAEPLHASTTIGTHTACRQVTRWR